jgi:hypothetical protein
MIDQNLISAGLTGVFRNEAEGYADREQFNRKQMLDILKEKQMMANNNEELHL